MSLPEPVRAARTVLNFVSVVGIGARMDIPGNMEWTACIGLVLARLLILLQAPGALLHNNYSHRVPAHVWKPDLVPA